MGSQRVRLHLATEQQRIRIHWTHGQTGSERASKCKRRCTQKATEVQRQGKREEDVIQRGETERRKMKTQKTRPRSRNKDSERLGPKAQGRDSRCVWLMGKPTCGRVYPRKRVVLVRARGIPMGTSASSRCASCRTASV